MPVSINHATRVITIPQADLTPVGPGLYELDVNALRLELKDHEDSEAHMALPDTHRHNTEVSLGGVTLARTVEIINGYTITFEDGQYAVRAVGANHNIADVMNVNQVSLRTNNSAGLIVASDADSTTMVTAILAATIETGLTFEEILRLIASAMFGKVTGAGTTNILFRDTNDTKNRIDATVDAVGNRTVVTLDPS